MTIKIYKDNAANAIFIEDSNGVQFLNSLQAVSGGVGVTINDLARNIDIVTNETPTSFVDKNNNTYGSTVTDVVNALNAIFTSSGSSGTELPTITSSLSINLVEGQTLNYELTADFGVGYEWDLSSVPSVTTVDGNIRKLVGGSSLSAGTYNIPVTATNYNGNTDDKTQTPPVPKSITLTVSTPPFANTKSVQFKNQDYLGANASLLASTLGRTGNGSGSGDAWTIAFWFKPSTNSSGQTIFYFGDNDITNAGHINIRFLGGNDNIRFQYGSNVNYLRFQSANNSLPADTWSHVLISYDGGTTGSSSNGLTSYYSRFKIFIDGVNVVSSGNWTSSNFGYSLSIDEDNLRVGRYASGNYLKDNCKVDELAVWDSDQSANVSDIYNSGTPFDLDTLNVSPTHWWRMGDGDSYPVIKDNVGNADFVMYNMTVADIVSDVP